MAGVSFLQGGHHSERNAIICAFTGASVSAPVSAANSPAGVSNDHNTTNELTLACRDRVSLFKIRTLGKQTNLMDKIRKTGTELNDAKAFIVFAQRGKFVKDDDKSRPHSAPILPNCELTRRLWWARLIQDVQPHILVSESPRISSKDHVG